MDFISGSVREFEKFFRSEGFSRRESLIAVKNLKKHESFKVVNDEKFSFTNLFKKKN